MKKGTLIRRDDSERFSKRSYSSNTTYGEGDDGRNKHFLK